MAYSAEISRGNPSCFLFLIDQSGSMADAWGGDAAKKKSEGLATIINNLLQGLVLICSNDPTDFRPRNYFSVGVIGYGANVGPAFSGALAGRELASITEIAEMPARIEERSKKVEDGVGGLINQSVKFPIWFEPVSTNGTPMCAALNKAHSILSGWLATHSNSFPPVVINITDGESGDGDPSIPAEALKRLSTSDGNVILLNVHLSGQKSDPILFPENGATMVDQYAKLLCSMSSPLTDGMKARARSSGISVSDNAMGFVFNADPVSVIQFLEIGTRPSNLR